MVVSCTFFLNNLLVSYTNMGLFEKRYHLVPLLEISNKKMKGHFQVLFKSFYKAF